MTSAQLDPYFYRQKPVNPDDWLAIATRDLVPSAQARVRAEIEAHYAEAVQRSRELGTAEAEANDIALLDLGSARAAGRRFCREHLTQRDAITLIQLTKRSTRSQTSGVLGLILIFTISWHYFPMKDPGTLVGIVLGFVFLYALDVSGFYFGKMDRNTQAGIHPLAAYLHRMVFGHLIASVVLGLGALALGWSLYRTGSGRAPDYWVIFAIFLFSSIRLYRLLRKLKTADTDDCRLA